MTKTILLLSFVCGIFLYLPVNLAFAQSNTKQTDTPFTLLLENVQKTSVQNEDNANFRNITPRQSLTTISGRRLKPGMRAAEFSNNNGARIAIAGLNGVGDTKADLIEYQIAARSKHAKNLTSNLASQYGKPDDIRDGMRIWYIQNPDTGAGQAKIITLSSQEIAGQLIIVANRTPISRRGELVVKPQRRLPQKEQKTQKPKADAAEKPRVQTRRVEKQF